MGFLGIADDDFVRGKTPMTKEEVRILAVAKARLKENYVVIDVGAGTGSLSVEAARQAAKGRVYSIEKTEEGQKLIADNAKKFGIDNIVVIAGEAPEAMEELPPSDAIFIGGSGGKLSAVLKTADDKLKVGGRLIITAITLETITTATDFLHENPRYRMQAVEVNITRWENVGRCYMRKALNPITLIVGEKVS